jgi:hypothetical protein
VAWWAWEAGTVGLGVDMVGPAGGMVGLAGGKVEGLAGGTTGSFDMTGNGCGGWGQRDAMRTAGDRLFAVDLPSPRPGQAEPGAGAARLAYAAFDGHARIHAAAKRGARRL